MAMYHPRALEPHWLAASEEFPALLLTGPRQVGKTTVLRRLCASQRRYVSLDDPALREVARSDPALFLQRFPPPVLIDEVQYAPELLPHVKLAIDGERRPGAFWLTGSQQFRMMKGVTETLAGRVGIATLLGFSQREASRRALDLGPFLPTAEELAARRGSASREDLRSIFAAIWRGTFPALVAGEVRNRDLFYASYVQTYLERDVRDLAQVGDRDAFLRFLRACAARTGQLLNLSDLARDVDVSVPTAKSWLSVLVASFQVHLLRPYETNVTKRLVKAPKLYLLDTGLAAWLTDWSSPETLAAGAMAGALFETWVVAEVLKTWWHRLRTPPVWYYRDRDRREVDLLFALDGRVHGLEVKRGASPRREWRATFTPLARLGDAPGEHAVVCLAPDEVPLAPDVVAVPVGYL